MVLSAGTKTFEIWKLGNYKWDINETWPRQIPPEYLPYTKKWGCKWMCRRGGHPKNTKKRHKINKISTLTWSNNSLQNTMKVRIFLMQSSTVWLDEGSTLHTGDAPSWTSIREVTLEKPPERGPNRLLLGFWRSVKTWNYNMNRNNI